jgi:hypothetical protein
LQVWKRFEKVLDSAEASYYALPDGLAIDMPHFAGQAWLVSKSIKEQLFDTKSQMDQISWVAEVTFSFQN